MKGRTARSQRGVTLLELMIALAVFSVGVLGLLRLTITGIESGATASRLSQATALASSKLDALLMQDFTASALAAGAYEETTNLGPGGTAYRVDGSAAGAYGATDGAFARSWVVADQDLNTTMPGDDYKLVTVTVSWYDGKAARSRTVVVTGGKSSQ